MANKKFIIGILLLGILTLTSCSTLLQDKNPDENKVQDRELSKGQKPSPESTQSSEETTDTIEKQVKSMSLKEKIGQMVIVGFDGYTVDDNTRAMIESYNVGGFILFSRNVESSKQLLDLLNSLKSINSTNKVPLFLSVDEEGGRVSRMPAEFKDLPTAKTIGKVNNSDFSRKIGSILAGEIKAFGFNMDFAPVLDINSNPNNPVIGDRSFGSNAQIVSKLGVQIMKGIRADGVIPVVKHFPGHGDTSVDSHVGLPSVNNSMESLKGFELVPFNDAIKNGADAVMIAHILLNKVDPQNPASLSKTVITDLLRKQMDFNGVIITDDMTMGAITKNYNISDAAIKAVNAGSDVVLVCHGYDNEVAVIDALTKAVKDGNITQEQIDKSIYRILKLKHKFNLTDNMINSVDVEKINRKINTVLK